MNDNDTHLIYESYRQDILEEGFIEDVAQKGKQIGLSLGLVIAILGAIKLGKINRETQKKIENEAIELRTTPEAIYRQLGIPELPQISSTNLPPGDHHQLPVPRPGVNPNIRAPENTPERIMDDIRIQGVIEDYIFEHEQLRTMAYDDGADNPTIGIGHFLNGSPEDRNLFTTLFGNELDYDRLVAGSGQVRRRGVPQVQQNLGTTPRGVELLNNRVQPQEMTQQQVRTLFNHDIQQVYIPRAQNNLRTHLNINLSDLTPEHQAAWVDLQFRGDFGRELRTIIQNARQAHDMGRVVTGLQERAQRQRLEHVRGRINRNARIIQTHLQELPLQQPNNR